MIPDSPIPAMMPPAMAKPMGWATWLPSARNDPTRERRSGVTCRVMVVSSRLPEMMMTVPPTHAHAAITTTGAGTDNAMNVATNGRVTAYASTSGRRGRSRATISPPVTNPRPKHATMAA